MDVQKNLQGAKFIVILYRKYNDDCELDYWFNLDGKSQLDLAKFIQEIDGKVISTLIANEVLPR